jgi:peroxiredoxin
MTIKVGDRLPESTFMIMTPEGAKPAKTSDIFGGKKVALFGLPGAYTNTCHRHHLPGYVQSYDELKKKGFDIIACTSTNDIHVLTQWSKDTGADGKILMLADGSAEFVKKVGLDVDLTARGMGIRSRRYSMLVEDGVVKSLNIEQVAGVVDASGAENMCRLG